MPGETTANGRFFYNPYAFVPADRSGVASGSGPVGGLGEGPPAPLGRLRPDRWTGRLRISLTAETPLLLTEVCQIEGDNHAIRQTRRDPRDTELAELLATAVKGMLRSGYEAATNSRFGVFSDHGRLTRRAGVEEAANLVPVRVERENGAVTATLLLGSATPGKDGKRGLQCALRVPRYHTDQECNVDRAAVRHGDRATALVATLSKGGRRVVEIVPDGAEPDREAGKRRARALATKLNGFVQGQLETVNGWYYETGHSIATKDDERLFYHDPKRHGRRRSLPVRDDVVAAWQVVMDSYRERREQTLKRPEAQALDSSPFVTADGEEFRAWRDLSRPTLCYAQVEGATVADYQITALYPVSVSRRTYPRSPAQLAEDQRVAPVRRGQEASPADRVFGWAATRSARRGRVRVGTPVQQPGSGIVELPSVDGGAGVPLAVLSSPKPSYELFYAGKPDGSPGELREGFGEEGGLRGRKVYPAHPRDDDRWRPDRDQPWRRPRGDDQSKVRDDQNASLLDWVPPGAVFEVDVWVEDLTEVEFGALLWLLSPERRHRIGLGRPLGFGTVRTTVDWNGSKLRDGAGWRAHYRLEQLKENGAGSLESLGERFVRAFEQDLERVYRNRRPRFLAALENALAGFPDDGPGGPLVQYPPNPDEPGSMADHFKWFIANSGAEGAKLPLGDLAGPCRDLRLPANPAGRRRSRPRR